MIKKKIVWEKWVDPLNSNIDEVEYPGHNFPSFEGDSHIEFVSSDPDFDEKYADEGEYGDEQDYKKNISYNPIRITATPHGFVSLTEHSFASKHFDFWTLHYNQDITKDIVDVIEKCQGVETVNVLTRYRARVGFNRILIQSKAFNLNTIRKNIENKILNLEKYDSILEEASELILFKQEVRDSVKEIKNRLSSSNNWAIYVLPNGKIETFSEYERSEAFVEKLELFNRIKSIIGGEVITSES